MSVSASHVKKEPDNDTDEMREEEDEDAQYEAKCHIDRDFHTQRYKELTAKIAYENIRNIILHKRLVEYYKKRKMDFAIREIDVGGEDDIAEENYHDKLKTYKDMKTRTTNKIAEIEQSLQATTVQKNKQEMAIKRLFDELQVTEKNTGTGLIYFQQGKPISEKLIERYLKVQKDKFYESAELHLRYIRARNAVRALEEELQSLETIAPGREVSGFETLSGENQNLIDKIEDRDTDLVKNRTLYAQYNGMLAHIREKMSHNQAVMENIKGDLGDVELEHLSARAELNAAKKELDSRRALLSTYKEKAGLLTKLDLLADFGETGKRYKNMDEYVENLRRKDKRRKYLRNEMQSSVKF